MENPLTKRTFWSAVAVTVPLVFNVIRAVIAGDFEVVSQEMVVAVVLSWGAHYTGQEIDRRTLPVDTPYRVQRLLNEAKAKRASEAPR